MKQHFFAKNFTAIACIMVLASIACNKISPELQQTNQPGAKGTAQTVTVATKAAQHCKIGSPLSTNGEFDFYVDTTNDLIIGLLGDIGGGFINYAEFIFAPDHVFSLFDKCNFTAYIYHFQYHITANIYDLRGRLILSIDDNKWQVFRNAAGKFNYDDNGFEVYDKDGRIAFNLNFVNGAWQYMYIKGIIPCTGSSLTYYNITGHYTMPYGTPTENAVFDHLYDSVPIQPLFRYTGKDWQHSRL